VHPAGRKQRGASQAWARGNFFAKTKIRDMNLGRSAATIKCMWTGLLGRLEAERSVGKQTFRVRHEVGRNFLFESRVSY
jgi:hypothetical protein